MSEWIQVGELAAGFGGYEVPPTGKLRGRSLRLLGEAGTPTIYEFDGDGTVAWHAAASRGKGAYRASELRPDVFFVDFLDADQPRCSHTLVIDLPAQAATRVSCTLPLQSETRRPLIERIASGLDLTPVSVTIDHPAIDRPYDAEPAHRESGDLIGKRVRYDYGPSDAYEHVYLNPRFFTWHCLAGSEAGLADTDRCHHYRIADSLYLFIWREKIVPTLGIVMIDLERRKTTGKLFGYRSDDFGAVTNLPVGARVTA